MGGRGGEIDREAKETVPSGSRPTLMRTGLVVGVSGIISGEEYAGFEQKVTKEAKEEDRSCWGVETAWLAATVGLAQARGRAQPERHRRSDFFVSFVTFCSKIRFNSLTITRRDRMRRFPFLVDHGNACYQRNALV